MLDVCVLSELESFQLLCLQICSLPLSLSPLLLESLQCACSYAWCCPRGLLNCCHFFLFFSVFSVQRSGNLNSVLLKLCLYLCYSLCWFHSLLENSQENPLSIPFSHKAGNKSIERSPILHCSSYRGGSIWVRAQSQITGTPPISLSRR